MRCIVGVYIANRRALTLVIKQWKMAKLPDKQLLTKVGDSRQSLEGCSSRFEPDTKLPQKMTQQQYQVHSAGIPIILAIKELNQGSTPCIVTFVICMPNYNHCVCLKPQAAVYPATMCATPTGFLWVSLQSWPEGILHPGLYKAQLGSQTYRSAAKLAVVWSTCSPAALHYSIRLAD